MLCDPADISAHTITHIFTAMRKYKLQTQQNPEDMEKHQGTDTFLDALGTNPLEFLFGKQGEHPPCSPLPSWFPILWIKFHRSSHHPAAAKVWWSEVQDLRAKQTQHRGGVMRC